MGGSLDMTVDGLSGVPALNETNVSIFVGSVRHFYHHYQPVRGFLSSWTPLTWSGRSSNGLKPT